jgi:hypothetical protein
MGTRNAAVVPALLASVLLFSGCGGGGGAAPPALSAAEEAHARELGAGAAAQLQQTLAPRIMAAIEEGGPAYAVQFCSSAADSLAAAASEAAGVELKRTSFRYRNPDNAPDRWEEEALRHFEGFAERRDSMPAGWVQAVSDDEMRYYAPLMVAPLCVQCHGAAHVLGPGVREVLADRYPDDRATGYAVGDMRGVIRVSIPRKPGGS